MPFKLTQNQSFLYAEQSHQEEERFLQILKERQKIKDGEQMEDPPEESIVIIDQDEESSIEIEI